ncbi:NAD(P)-binding domain-containing protein [Anaerotalea alkaliphila]|uniref:NAD(P)-binding domain-containing protein n=1 Tax=Anaerotalea alkaliphila TaxID=2662126 RepID=A0A7X5HUD4_9FIRM|nr:NAD(P)-binding domain-containing protein [Anaerotalea alkaliphila]NDL66795.1 NAD(P)-binding domain-containing protein [Anaerotalea alkaliphila]
MKTVHTAIVGGGQAGLATSYFLKQRNIDHVILEQAAQAGNAWRNFRWDSFTLLTPNWSIRMPGAFYDGDAPDGFMQRDELVAYFENYITAYGLPIRHGIRVTGISARPDGEGYTVQTDQEPLIAKNVVVATGLFQGPKITPFGEKISSRVLQIHATQYRNPKQLPSGAVLVIGSAQSGAQIAEELYKDGRKVFLAVGGAGRVPRRYRGKDIVFWLNEIGFFDRTVDMLDSPKSRFAANPHLSGTKGGHAINLHQFVRDGVQLLGHAIDGDKERVLFAGDLKESLAKTDRIEADVIKAIDAHILRQGLDVPPETLPELRDGYAVAELRELDLVKENIGSIIWAQGFSFDYSMVKLPVLDEAGFPIQKRGVTEFAGLYFVGMPYLYKQKSGLLMGVGEDAGHIASHIASWG